jgi:hypothetical protein
MRALPVPSASATALGGFGICGNGGGACNGGEFGCPRARIIAMGRFVGRGVEEYIGIFDAVPVSIACMW